MPQDQKSEGNVYAKSALAQIPRALTLLDRNPASPTYGCFDRSWWLDRSTDFPNALAQYPVHGLAMVWARPYADNPYYQKPIIKRWAVAALAFLVKQAHKDGSWDEFYPNERGWSGPSGFLLYSMLSAYELLQVEPTSALGQEIKLVAGRCAHMHLERTEKGTLANHYAMAFLPVAKTWQIFGFDSLKEPLARRFDDLLALQNPEGWFKEYDGPDAGYLSATVSFLAKMEKVGFIHPGLRPAVEKSLPFLSHYFWPDGTMGGALASRQTVHVYPHGLEYFASSFPLAASLAKAARKGVEQGGFVPPSIQSDHYYHYRVNEYLEAAFEAKKLPKKLEQLPYEKKPFMHFFPNAGLLAVKKVDYYSMVNLRKGGAIRAYDLSSKEAVLVDSGVQVKLEDGTVATSNWVDPSYEIDAEGSEVVASGKLCRVPSKNFTPAKFILFRLFILTFGASSNLAEAIKGLLRNLLTLGVRKTDIGFERRILFEENGIRYHDEVKFGAANVTNLWVGAELPVRYVPQSRHFQRFELNFDPISPEPVFLKSAVERGHLSINQSIEFPSLKKTIEFRSGESIGH